MSTKVRTILDELFDLSGRGKWFRRQISQLCTTILENSFFAGKITHRMKEITEELTSDETVSGYIIKLTESLFPQGSSFFNGMLATCYQQILSPTSVTNIDLT